MADISLILLNKPADPDMVAVVRTLGARHPALGAKLVQEADDPDAQASSLIQCGDESVVVMSMPAPIPDDPGMWERAQVTWPDAGAVAARHQGHIIVSVLGPGQGPLANARITTAVIGALIATMPDCCAVAWDAKVVRRADLWLQMSAASFAPFPNYPVSLWFDILPFRTKTGIGAVTMGLEAFAEREIEFETSRLTLQTLVDRIGGLAVYLAEHGPVINDGDTFGGDEQERFSVRHTKSNRFGDLPVLLCSDASK